MKTFLVYPHQLFEHTKIYELLDTAYDTVCIVEDPLYFTQYTFHKQKILFHRASMKKYESFLKEKGYRVHYINVHQLKQSEDIAQYVSGALYMYDPVDNWLEKKLKKTFGDSITFLDTPMFLNSKSENTAYFLNKKPFMKNFYEWQRKRLHILMDEHMKPLGGKYSFDTDNRKKLPKNYSEPANNPCDRDKYVIEAQHYVEEHFSDHYGYTEHFNFATDFTSAKRVLKNFLENKLEHFGIYEDAISKEKVFLNHSILTPYLNIGLLTPDYVITETLAYARTHTVALNSLEGFIRQIIGWREFIRAMYDIHGTPMRTKNFWKHTKKIPHIFWTGTTDNSVVNHSIHKALHYAYTHHIERLMILGNYMVLSEFDPDDVYRWFMEMYIDSYDWVMVPNVYGMSQFADGGIFATKPYISAANYILKMSDFKRDGLWDTDWDEKFWAFLKKHKSFFEKNIRFKMLLKRID